MSINITGTLVPASSTFGIVNASDMNGGAAEFANEAAIGAIATARLVVGQRAYAQGTGIEYQLVSLTPAGGFANGTWSPIVIPAGGAWSPGADAVSTSNIMLSNNIGSVFNGVTIAVGMRVLVIGQTSSAQNGPYVAASGGWTRSSDAASAGAFVVGKTIAVLAGTLAGTIYVCNLAPTVLNTDPITFIANTTGAAFNPHAPGPIGDVTPSTAAFSALIMSGAITLATGQVPILGGERAVSHDNTATYTALSSEYNGFGLNVLGTLTADRNLNLPLSAGWPVWLIKNGTTGGFAINVGGSTGTRIKIPSGGLALVTTDSTNFYAVSGGGSTPIDGTIHTASITAAVSNVYKFNLNGGPVTQPMPGTVSEGDTVEFVDAFVGGSFQTNNLTLTTTAGVKILAFGTFVKGTSCVISNSGWFRFRAFVDSAGDTVWSQF